jgi:hypothetical protein
LSITSERSLLSPIHGDEDGASISGTQRDGLFGRDVDDLTRYERAAEI